MVQHATKCFGSCADVAQHSAGPFGSCGQVVQHAKLFWGSWSPNSVLFWELRAGGPKSGARFGRTFSVLWAQHFARIRRPLGVVCKWCNSPGMQPRIECLCGVLRVVAPGQAVLLFVLAEKLSGTATALSEHPFKRCNKAARVNIDQRIQRPVRGRGDLLGVGGGAGKLMVHADQENDRAVHGPAPRVERDPVPPARALHRGANTPGRRTR